MNPPDHLLPKSARARLALAGRSPGERAFDLCFFGSLASGYLASATSKTLLGLVQILHAQHGTADSWTPAVATWWKARVECIVGLLLLALWLKLVHELWQAREDPAAGVLHVVSGFLLLGLGGLAFSFLCALGHF